MPIMTAGTAGIHMHGLVGARRTWIHGMAAAAFMAALVPSLHLQAQGLENPDTIEAIVGSEIQEEERTAAADADKIVAAIEKTSESITAVRKTSNVDKVDIVFLADATALEGGPPPSIEKKVEEHKAEIAQLRQEIEGNALLFHAIDSRSVLMRDIIAVDFTDPKNVIIYAAAKPAR